MKFSAHIHTRISDWQFVKELEDLGYDAAWVPDTQMQWSDCYSVMALAAANTSRMSVATAPMSRSTRLPEIRAARF